MMEAFLWAAKVLPILKPFYYIKSLSYTTWMFVVVLVSYGGLFYLRLKHREKLSHFVHWIPPFLQLGLWSNLLATAKQSPPSISIGWGVLAIIFIVSPLLFDRQEKHPEWLSTSLLFASLACVLWTFLVTSTSPGTSSLTGVAFGKNKALLEVTMLLSTFAGVGFLITASMLSWQIQYNPTARTTALEASYQSILQLATLAFSTSIVCILFGTWKPHIFVWGNLVLGSLALVSTMLPTLLPASLENSSDKTERASHSLEFSSVHGLVTKTAGFFAVLWLFLHLILTA